LWSTERIFLPLKIHFHNFQRLFIDFIFLEPLLSCGLFSELCQVGIPADFQSWWQILYKFQRLHIYWMIILIQQSLFFAACNRRYIFCNLRPPMKTNIRRLSDSEVILSPEIFPKSFFRWLPSSFRRIFRFFGLHSFFCYEILSLWGNFNFFLRRIFCNFSNN